MALATTRSAPSDSGCWPSGVAVVLSTIRCAPRPWQIVANRCRSTTSSPGLVGVFGQNHVGARSNMADLGTDRFGNVDPNGHKVFGRIAAHLVVAVSGHY